MRSHDRGRDSARIRDRPQLERLSKAVGASVGDDDLPSSPEQNLCPEQADRPHPTIKVAPSSGRARPPGGCRRAARPYPVVLAERAGQRHVVRRGQPFREAAGRDPRLRELCAGRRTTGEAAVTRATRHRWRTAHRVPSASTPATSWPSTVPVGACPSFSTSDPQNPHARTSNRAPGPVGQAVRRARVARPRRDRPRAPPYRTGGARDRTRYELRLPGRRLTGNETSRRAEIAARMFSPGLQRGRTRRAAAGGTTRGTARPCARQRRPSVRAGDGLRRDVELLERTAVA